MIGIQTLRPFPSSKPETLDHYASVDPETAKKHHHDHDAILDQDRFKFDHEDHQGLRRPRRPMTKTTRRPPGDNQVHVIRLMIEILHYLKDPKLWKLWYILGMGNAGFLSSTVLSFAMNPGPCASGKSSTSNRTPARKLCTVPRRETRAASFPGKEPPSRSVLFTPDGRTQRVATLFGENGALNPINPQPNPEPVGHTMVIHDFDGGRIACSPITDVLELRHPLLGFKV